MICPFASWRPINANYGGKMTDHLGLVVHVQEGYGSLYGYFSNPTADVSAHFWCSKTGSLEQYLDTDTVAWAEVGGNNRYTSCEFEGYQNESMTQQQLNRGAQLIDWLNGVYHWPITGPVPHGSPGVTPHCNPDGTPDSAWGNHTCPGSIRLAQIPAMVKLAQPKPPTKEYVVMDSTTAPNGDIVSHAVTPQGHYLEITRKAGKQGNAAIDGLSIIDITAQFPGFVVAP